MMQFIRERSKGLLSFLLLGFIALTFALWGINSYFTGPTGNAVAKVGARTITADEFSRFYQQQYRQVQSLYGDAFRPEMVDEAAFKRKVLDAMIADASLRQHLIQQRMVITDAQLAEAINQLPTFQENGEFSPSVYQQWLQARGYSPAAFENELRGSLLTEQVRAGVRNTAFVTPKELEGVVELTEQQRDIAVMGVTLASLTSQVMVTDAALEAFYQQNAALFETQDRIRVNYVQLERKTLAEQIQPNETALRELYQREKNRFSTPERRRVRHIQVKDESTAQALAQRLKESPESFATLAREKSEDSGSASKGGDLGWVETGMLPAALDQAVYTAKPKEPVGPIKGPDGYHLLWIDSVEAGKQESFEQLRGKLLEEYRNEQLSARWNELIESIETVNFEQPSSLDPVAKLANSPIKTTDWFTREVGNAPANSPRFREASFSEEVLKDGLNSALIQLDEDSLAVVRLEDHQPSRVPPLKEIQAQVREAYLKSEAIKLADQKIQQAEQALSEGSSPAEAAAEIKGNYREIGWIDRQGGKNLPVEVTTKAFALVPPEEGRLRYERVILPNDDRLLILVREVKDGDARAVDQATLDKMRKRVSEVRGDQDLALYLEALKKTVKVTTYPDRL